MYNKQIGIKITTRVYNRSANNYQNKNTPSKYLFLLFFFFFWRLVHMIIKTMSNYISMMVVPYHLGKTNTRWWEVEKKQWFWISRIWAWQTKCLMINRCTFFLQKLHVYTLQHIKRWLPGCKIHRLFYNLNEILIFLWC